MDIRFLLEMTAELLTRLDLITIEPAPAPDEFADTVPAVQHGALDLELGHD